MSAEPLSIDFVSPLPPVRSGIADYSRDLLPHLEPLCDLRVIRLPELEVGEEVRERWKPVPAADCGAGGRLPLYQMGNNRYHEGVLRLALERPGVVTLHDLVLHHLLVEATLAHADAEGYRERLAADHGWIGEIAARARRWGELGQAAMFELPVHRGLVRRQRGALVHSRWARELLLEDDPDLQVRVVPMAMPLPARPPAAAGADLRRRLGLPAERPLIGCFGFQTPIKRIEVVVDALARPALAGADLVIAGEVSPVVELEEKVRRAGVGERVHVTGFLDYEDFEAAIAACAACVNLRYPTAGETSASLLRILAMGRPVAVTDYAQFAELPDEIAVKVPLGEREPAVLAAELGRLIGQPERLRAMGEAAREYVRSRHDPARAAAAIVAACRELAPLQPPAETAAGVPAPTTLTWLELRGELQVEGAGRPWGEGEARRLEISLTNRGFSRWLPATHPVGGVLVEVQWREYPEGPPLERRWADLPVEVAPGGSYRLQLDTRRPRGASVLVVEPHVAGVSGFSSLGGPRWVGEL